MGNIKLLDCTLRDGGYINDWEFGHENLINIFERIVDSGVDIIEVGFLDERRKFDFNRSIMPNTDCIGKIYGNLDKRNTMVVGMIDYGTCSLNNIKPCKESYIDGIRVIFKKDLRKEALLFCKELKNLGYKVFAQLVSITSYDDDEILDLIRIANEVKPYAVSMVDTYGLMHQKNLQRYFELLNEHLENTIGLGYHAHNNFQMGYANCIQMLSNSIEREIIVDGTIYGMGKSAGNAPIELLAMYMNNNFGTNYNINQILEAIDSNITQFYHQPEWGYNMFYFLAAFNECHPNYVADLMEKRTLSVKSINEILAKLQGEKKLLYDKNYIETLYSEYQYQEINDDKDRAELKKIFHDRKIMILGSDSITQTEKHEIRTYVRQNNVITISVDHIDADIDSDYLFISNSKKYLQLSTHLSQDTYCIIATSNITATGERKFNYILNLDSLIGDSDEFEICPLGMIMNLLHNMDVSDLMIVGFDDYKNEKLIF